MGKIKEDFSVDRTTAGIRWKTCHGCDGKGWVEVGGNEFWYPFVPGDYYPTYPQVWY
jgi:hypothetical protein